MTAAFSESLWLDLRLQFEEQRNMQLELIGKHEAVGNYGMAYLALWAALEHFAIRLVPVDQRRELKEDLSDWVAYLKATGGNTPVKIGLGKFDIAKLETAKIPYEGTLPLEPGKNFYLVTATTAKFRARLNEIAHSESAASQKIYEDFKLTTSVASSEVEAWLSLRSV